MVSLQTLSSLKNLSCFQSPAERGRLYFLLAWFHAIVLERLRYNPQGWTKKYEFSEADLRVACDMIDTWIDSAAMVRFFTIFFFLL